MRCGSCGTELIAGKAFCHACGARAIVSCHNCGATLQPGFRFCPDCGTAVDEGEPDQPVPRVEDRFARLSQHIPTALAERIRATQSTSSGERKLVTVLFCDLAGSTAIAAGLDPEVYRDLLDAYLELAFREIYRFDGIVNQLAGDGMMALFGAPLAHEDAPQRAVRAALAIRDAMERFNAEVTASRGIELWARIGINTGPVVVGTVGNDLKMDYTAIGDTTNLASRLESLATPRQILISETTYRLVRGFFCMNSVGPLAVKGKSEPVAAYEVIGLSDATTPMAVAAARGMTPLAGRMEELAQLRACYDRLAGNLAQVVTIVGEAGSGKSRLLYEFRQQLAGEPVAFFESRCSALTRALPYAPFVRMLKHYFGIGAEDGAAAAADNIERRLRDVVDDGEELYPQLCRLLSVGGDWTSPGAADELKREQFEVVSQLITEVSQRVPVVMMIEDLQWIDEDSREMLEMAAARMARKPVMLVTTYRPDYQPSWKIRTAYTQLHLRPLVPEESGQIIRSLIGSLPPVLEERILLKAEGNPFFTEELARTLVEQGYLVPDGDAVRLTRPIEEILIPDTIHEVIAARLDRLGSDAKRVVQVAAVMGRQFSGATLIEVLEPEHVDVPGALSELEQRGVLHRKNLLADDEYRFGESLTQEVAYEGLLLKERRQLHDRIGALFEARPEEMTTERSTLMAHHFSRSGNHEKAFAALTRAAQAAAKLPSYPAAIEYYRQAWMVAEAALREQANGDATWQRRTLDAALDYCRTSTFYGATEALDSHAARRAHELGEILGDTDAIASGYTFEGLILMSGEREEFARGVALVEKGLEVARQGGQAVSGLSVRRALAFAYLHDGRLELALQMMEWVVRELEGAAVDTHLDSYVGARFGREVLRYYCDDIRGALTGARDAYQLAVRAGNRTVQSASSGLQALAAYHLGDYAEAKRWGDTGLAVGEAIGNVASTRTCATVALAARVALGEGAVAQRYLELIEQEFRARGDMATKSLLVIEAFLGLGELERARRFAEEAYAHAGGALREATCAAALGRVSLQSGPSFWDDAQHWFEHARLLAERIGSRSTLAAAKLGAAELAALRDDRTAAARLLDQALTLCREIGAVHYQRQAERLLAEIDPNFTREVDAVA